MGTQRTFFVNLLLDEGLVQDVTKDVLQDADMPADVPLVQNITSTGGTITPTTGTNSLNIDLTPIVTAGSFTNTNITIDKYGRVTAAANGSSGSSNPRLFTDTGNASTSGTSLTQLYTHNLTAGQFAAAGDVVEWLIPFQPTQSGNTFTLGYAGQTLQTTAMNVAGGILVVRVMCTTFSDPNSVLTATISGFIPQFSAAGTGLSTNTQTGLTLANTQTFTLSATAGSGTLTALFAHMNYWAV